MYPWVDWILWMTDQLQTSPERFARHVRTVSVVCVLALMMSGAPFAQDTALSVRAKARPGQRVRIRRGGSS